MHIKKNNYLDIVDCYYHETFKQELSLNKYFISYFNIEAWQNTKLILKKTDRIRYYIVKNDLNVYLSDNDICNLFYQIPEKILLEYLNTFKSIYFNKVDDKIIYEHFKLNDLNNSNIIFEGQLVNYIFPKIDLQLNTKFDCSIDLNDLNCLLCFIIHKDSSADELTQSNNCNLKSTLMKYILKIEFILDLENIKVLKEEANTKNKSFFKSSRIKERLKEFEGMI